MALGNAGSVSRRDFLIGAGAAAVAAACSPSREADEPVPGAPAGADEIDAGAGAGGVVMVGDSLTVGALDELQELLAAAGIGVARTDGESSRRMVVDQTGGPVSGVTALGRAVADGLEPDVWVIALGTNDVAKYTPEQIGAVILELLAAVPADGAGLVWVNTYVRNAAEQAAAFNAALDLALDERPFAVIADWAQVASEDGLVGADGVHLTEDGNVAFAALVVSAVQELV